MIKEQALAILKQPERIGCHLIKANDEESNKYNQESIEALNMAIKALEIVEEFERAQIITGGRLNGRTYAYKCGLEDGKRKALEQSNDDCVSRKAILDAITEIDDNINMYIYTNEVREIIKALPSVTSTFPKNATNGDMIKAMFPNIEADEIKTDTGGYIAVKYLDTTEACDSTAFRKNWWNAPYEEKRGNKND